MRRTEAGVTLVELMIGTVILFLVAGAAISLTVVFMRSFALHQRMVIVERSGRVSLEVIADALRNASPAVPSGQIGDLTTCASPGAFTIEPGVDGPDSLEVVHASGAVVTSLRQAFTADSTALVVADAGALAVDDLVVVSNLTRGHVAKITGIREVDGEWHLATTAPASCSDPGFPGGGYPQGSLIVRARISRFFIGEFLGVPTLMVDIDGDGPVEAEPLADGIEDLQVAVGIDVDGDGAVRDTGDTSDEWFYNAAGDGAPPAIATTVPRAVRVTVIARAAHAEAGTPSFLRPSAEDRAGADMPDNYRRRVLAETVEIRNLEGSQ